MLGFLQDTICAVSTPPGKGAIAIVRLSGGKSVAIVDRIFKGQKKIADVAPATLNLGKILASENGRFLDEVMVAKFLRPFSYTGEDVVEINCHGGPYIVQEILNVLLENGARLAEPGEFTKRAFLNGKIDLLQAESIIDVINSQTKTSLQFAQKQLSGLLSERLLTSKEALKRQLALLEIELDFSEEDIEFASRKTMLSNISGLVDEIDKLIDSYKYGQVLREGIHLALVGKPNVGKSSVLNRLLEEDRAIVSDTPGTTRDVIEESLDINGVLFKLSDTAGIRLAQDNVEAQGVERTRQVLTKADVVLFIVDGSAALDKLDAEAKEIMQSAQCKKKLLLGNKSDLGKVVLESSFASDFQDFCYISAKTGAGFNELRQKLVALSLTQGNGEISVALNKARHLDAVRRTRQHILRAEESIKNNLSAEFVALDMRAALDALGEITGEVTTDEVLNDIFSSFCIGK